MFGRTVEVAGRAITVFCCPDTPLSEVLRRAAIHMEREEKEEHDKNPNVIKYREAMSALNAVRGL
jgi:hypothetical protein